MNYKYCPICSNEFVFKKVRDDNRERLVCEKCGFVYYLNPAPATAVILINDNNEILLVKRKFEPHKGEWSLPAGFLEYEETVEECAIRELKEETNLDVELDGLYGVYSALENPHKNILLVVYNGHKVGGELHPGDDAMDAKYFSLDALPEKIAFGCHRHILRQLNSKSYAELK